jgi:hypothetical protein
MRNSYEKKQKKVTGENEFYAYSSARRTNGKNPGMAELSVKARTRYDGLATLNFFHFYVF